MSLFDTSELRKHGGETKLSQELANDRVGIAIAFCASIAASLAAVYLTYGTERLEQVYFQQEKMDVPTMLSKVRTDTDPIKNDRWVRGFVRRFVGYYFLMPDDSSEFAKKGLAWLHAHSGKSGKERSEALLDGFSRYDSIRKTKYPSFYPINDFSSIKIRQSDADDSQIWVEIPGTYGTKTEEGESFTDAKLKLVIQRVPVSGKPSSLGEINVTGLIVLDASIDFVDDYTRPNEVTHWSLFHEK